MTIKMIQHSDHVADSYMGAVVALLSPAAVAAAGFTVQSWNNTDPETFPTSVLAITAAAFRAKVEGTLVKVLDNVTNEQAEVHADGHVGKWL